MKGALYTKIKYFIKVAQTVPLSELLKYPNLY